MSSHKKQMDTQTGRYAKINSGKKENNTPSTNGVTCITSAYSISMALSIRSCIASSDADEEDDDDDEEDEEGEDEEEDADEDGQDESTVDDDEVDDVHVRLELRQKVNFRTLKWCYEDKKDFTEAEFDEKTPSLVRIVFMFVFIVFF